jgi:threonine synthase
VQRHLALINNAASALKLDFLSASTSEEAKRILVRCVMHARENRIAASEVTGMATHGRWMIDIAFDTDKLLAALSKAAKSVRWSVVSVLSVVCSRLMCTTTITFYTDV